MSDERPPASEQTNQWRELADVQQQLAKDPLLGYEARGALRDGANALVVAADACDQLEQARQHRHDDTDCAFAEAKIDLEADNAKLRELLARAREALVECEYCGKRSTYRNMPMCGHRNSEVLAAIDAATKDHTVR